MTRRYIHYESAFEDLLQHDGIGYVAVDEARKSALDGSKVKCFDFLVYTGDREVRLVDVKGRRFPYEGRGGRRYWENWVTRDDLESLDRWQGASGESTWGEFVFAYWLGGPADCWPDARVHVFRERRYAFLAVRADEYRCYCRRRSERWGTFSVPRDTFRRLARPVETWWDSRRDLDPSCLLSARPAYNEGAVGRSVCLAEG